MKIILAISFALLIGVCLSELSSSDNVYKFEIDLGNKEYDKICPNKRTKCNETQTCCKTKHNSYHCCRYRNAVCCPDHYHCCPRGFTCDAETKRCTLEVNFLALHPSKPRKNPMEWEVKEDNVKATETCPNKRTKCKDTQTCCITKLGNYHCCKYPNAVCCSDKYHCCPEDSTCDLKRKKCNKNGIHPMIRFSKSLSVRIPSSEKRKNENLINEPLFSDITCPNNKTKCKDTKTCCVTKYGNYYCCPHKNAVCCSDKWLCCAEGKTCDIKNKKCLDSSNNFKIITKKLQLQLNTEYESSKDSNIAGCCSDPENCCKDGSKCDPKTKQCILINENQREKLKHIENSNGMWSLDETNNKVFENEKKCPNNKTTCKETKTCCITKHENYYCCPHKNAVCCSDKWSCCPEGSTCDVKNKKCNTAKLSRTPLIAANELAPLNNDKSNMKISLTFLVNVNKNCGNSNISCPNKGKCCPMKDAKSGCCSFSKGLCCSDYLTCCPENSKCDIFNKVCVTKIVVNLPVQTFEKVKTDICPDNKSECFSWQTCCLIDNGEYGCCPHVNAVCCSDKESCCPHNAKCDIKNHQCIKTDSQLSTDSFLIKTKTVFKRKSLEIFLNEISSGNKKCGEHNTFCPISYRKYGCCSYKSVSIYKVEYLFIMYNISLLFRDVLLLFFKYLILLLESLQK